MHPEQLMREITRLKTLATWYAHEAAGGDPDNAYCIIQAGLRTLTTDEQGELMLSYTEHPEPILNMDVEELLPRLDDLLQTTGITPEVIPYQEWMNSRLHATNRIIDLLQSALPGHLRDPL